MARRKGVTKTKTNAKKSSTAVDNNTKVTEGNKIKDDPGGTTNVQQQQLTTKNNINSSNAVTSAMDLIKLTTKTNHNQYHGIQHQQQQQHQQTIITNNNNIINKINNNNNNLVRNNSHQQQVLRDPNVIVNGTHNVINQKQQISTPLSNQTINNNNNNNKNYINGVNTNKIINNDINSDCDNNNDNNQKYLHKKFKRIASTTSIVTSVAVTPVTIGVNNVSVAKAQSSQLLEITIEPVTATNDNSCAVSINNNDIILNELMKHQLRQQVVNNMTTTSYKQQHHSNSCNSNNNNVNNLLIINNNDNNQSDNIDDVIVSNLINKNNKNCVSVSNNNFNVNNSNDGTNIHSNNNNNNNIYISKINNNNNNNNNEPATVYYNKIIEEQLQQDQQQQHQKQQQIQKQLSANQLQQNTLINNNNFLSTTTTSYNIKQQHQQPQMQHKQLLITNNNNNNNINLNKLQINNNNNSVKSSSNNNNNNNINSFNLNQQHQEQEQQKLLHQQQQHYQLLQQQQQQQQQQLLQHQLIQQHNLVNNNNNLSANRNNSHHQQQQQQSISVDCSNNNNINKNNFNRNNINNVPLTTITTTTVTPVITVNPSSIVITETTGSPSTTISTPGRNICPYCSLVCLKPSVLKKHIRAHTNERPYPCQPCGIAFKTRSNLYKHRRSRAHSSRVQGVEIQPDDELSLCSDQDQDQDQELSSNASGSDVLSRTQSPMDDRALSPSSSVSATSSVQHWTQLTIEKPYKPKFHNAALYASDEQQVGASRNNKDASHPNQQANSYQQQSSVHQQHQHPQIGQGNTTITVVPSVTSGSSSHHPLANQNVEYLKQHISKIISENETIMEVVEPALQRKYHKITGISRGMVVGENSSNSKLAIAETRREEAAAAAAAAATTLATSQHNTNYNSSGSVRNLSQQQQQQQQLQQQQQMQQQMQQQQKPVSQVQSENFLQPPQLSVVAAAAAASVNAASTNSNQPLNLSILSITTDAEHSRKRCYSEGFTGQDVANHPQNPERSIIKDLLLNSRGFGAVQAAEGDDTVYTCQLCNISFRSADNLKYHTICYCQGGLADGNSPQSAPNSPGASPSHHYIRSNSMHGGLPERYNPNTLVKLARSSLSNPSAKTPSSLAKLARTQLRQPKQKPENIIILPGSPISASTSSKGVDTVHTPLPSPGPLLGKTRLVDAYCSSNTSSTCNTNANISSIVQDDELNKHSNTDSKVDVRIDVINQQPLQESGIKRELNSESNEDISLQQTLSKRARLDSLQLPSTPSSLMTMDEMSPRFRLQMFGGEVTVLDKNVDNRMRHYGGTMVDNSKEVSDDDGSFLMRTSALHSGGSVIHQPSTTIENITPITPKLLLSMTPTLTPSLVTPNLLATASTTTHFQFPPIYNPLTLPASMSTTSNIGNTQATTILHAGKMIPFVPGIPGPNTLGPPPSSSPKHRYYRQSDHTPLNLPPPPPPRSVTQPPQIPIIKIDAEEKFRTGTSKSNLSGKNGVKKHHQTIWSPVTPKHNLEIKKSSFNYTRMADNISPRKDNSTSIYSHSVSTPKHNLISRNLPEDTEIRYFNFENLISKSEIIVRPPSPSPQIQIETKIIPTTPSPPTPSQHNEEKREISLPSTPVKSSKFLRPTSLPLKPGTFTPKRHHGITPTANTMPLISPETPRPSKTCGQLYINGHAYTYLGLKCTTKPFYCTVNRPQPVHFANNSSQPQQISVYCNWQAYADSHPHPLGLDSKTVMSVYNSRHRDNSYSTKSNTECKTIASLHQPLITTPFEINKASVTGIRYNYFQMWQEATKPITVQQIETTVIMNRTTTVTPTKNVNSTTSENATTTRSSPVAAIVPGGYESNEDYTYVRGRGRGRYVCFECGIRCKKPSMLKKHIRTHTDVRPFTCQHCAFSFKTKGNLTKHMKSKTHYKKCKELGINISVDLDGEYGLDGDMDGCSDHHSLISGGRSSSSTMQPGDESDVSDQESDDDDAGWEESCSDTEDSKSRLQEHEAAKSLLCLSMTPPTVSCSNNNNNPNNAIMQQNHRAAPFTSIDTHNPGLVIASTANEQVNQFLYHHHQQQQHMQQSQVSQQQHAKQSSRRVVGMPFPKPAFDLLKHEQYYSNPSVHLPKSIKTIGPIPVLPNGHVAGTNNAINSNQSMIYDDAVNMPMDLTKPRDNEMLRPRLPPLLPPPAQIMSSPLKVSDVITPMTDPARLLSSLVLITDKISIHPKSDGFADGGEACGTPTMVVASPVGAIGTGRIEDTTRLQQYITERALLDRKMKQSQKMSNFSTISGGNASASNMTSTTPSIVTGNSANSNYCNSIMTSISSKSSPHISISVIKTDDLISPSGSSGDGINSSGGGFGSAFVRMHQLQRDGEKVAKAAAVHLYSNSPTMAAPHVSVSQKEIILKSIGVGQTGSSNPTLPVASFKHFSRSDMQEAPRVAQQPDRISTSSAFNKEMSLNVKVAVTAPNTATFVDEQAATVSGGSVQTVTSGMDTLAEIASISVKLDVANSIITRDSVSPVSFEEKNKASTGKDSAKSVASEYLKITSAKYLNMPPKGTALTTDDAESGSDQEVSGDKTASGGNDLGIVARTVVVGEDGFKSGPGGDFPATYSPGRITEDGRSVCHECHKTFQKPSQLRLHINIHYIERKYRCDACSVSFRTQGHLIKHERSISHHTKVSMTSTFGVATETNPRPFKCQDCSSAFRIHGHLAKHLRSKMHVMRLECLHKLPFGTYAEIERAGVSLTAIDTTDCDNSLASLQLLAQRLHEKDPSKLGAWIPETMAPPPHHIERVAGRGDSDSCDEGEPDDMLPPGGVPPVPTYSADISNSEHIVKRCYNDSSSKAIESGVPALSNSPQLPIHATILPSNKTDYEPPEKKIKDQTKNLLSSLSLSSSSSSSSSCGGDV